MNLLKRGLKLTLFIGEEDKQKVLENISNFTDKPLKINLDIHTQKQLQKLKQITSDQRNKIFAILSDMEKATGEEVEKIRMNTKLHFMQMYGIDDFSLSDCDIEVATKYIEYLITLSLDLGVSFSENPRDAFGDDDKYFAFCISNRVCAVCGKINADIHHYDAIGMGKNRKKYDDSAHKKIALCRNHHSEAHTIGREDFSKKYHVYGIII